MISAECYNGGEVFLRIELPEQGVFETCAIDGEAAVKLGHSLIQAGEKALKAAGKIHE